MDHKPLFYPIAVVTLAAILMAAAATPPASGQATSASSLAGSGQSAGFQAIMAGATHPLTLKLKDLDGSWRRVTACEQAGMGVYTQAIEIATGLSNGVYYTQGDTVESAGQTYLVAYSLPARKVDLATLYDRGYTTIPPVLTPDTGITLSLVDMRTVGALSDVRTFSLQDEIADSAAVATEIRKEREQAPYSPTPSPMPTPQPRVHHSGYDADHPPAGSVVVVNSSGPVPPPAPMVVVVPSPSMTIHTSTVTTTTAIPWDPSMQTVNRLGALTRCLLEYAHKHHGLLPPMKNGSAFKSAAFKYAGYEASIVSLINPTTGKPFGINGSLSQRKLTAIGSPRFTVTFYEAAPEADGTRIVAFLDGSVSRLNRAEWQQRKLASGIR